MVPDLLPVGSQAPEFEALDQDGRVVRLGDARGRALVLYFYPEDGTAGCTAEACAFRDLDDAFRDADLLVWGVSVDDVESHAAFAHDHELPFPLLADPERRITEAYGALGDDGRSVRATFLIGPDGRIDEVFPRVKPDAHPAEVLAAARRTRRPATLGR